MVEEKLTFVVASYPRHPDIIFRECSVRYNGSKPVLENELLEAIKQMGEGKGKNYTLVIEVGKRTAEEIKDIERHRDSIY